MQLLSFVYIRTKGLNQPKQIRLSLEIEWELNSEYNRLKNEAHQKARDTIVRCASILEELGHPVSGIAAKLTEDLPYHRATV